MLVSNPPPPLNEDGFVVNVVAKCVTNCNPAVHTTPPPRPETAETERKRNANRRTEERASVSVQYVAPRPGTIDAGTDVQKGDDNNDAPTDSGFVY